MFGKSVSPVDEDEHYATLTWKLYKDHLNYVYVVSLNVISVIYRQDEKKTTQGPDHRDFIVKFCRRDTKMDVLSASRPKKTVNLYINESLTPVRQTMSYVLRKAKLQFTRIISGSSIKSNNYLWI